MIQIPLTDSQSVILSGACARDDGAVFPVTANLKGGAVGNVCKSFLKHGLIAVIPATDLNTVWRHDEERGPPCKRRRWRMHCLGSPTTRHPQVPPRSQPNRPAAALARSRTH